MDPNESLAQMREAIEAIWAADDADPNAVKLAESAGALDMWLGRGGFLPDAWSRR